MFLLLHRMAGYLLICAFFAILPSPIIFKLTINRFSKIWRVLIYVIYWFPNYKKKRKRHLRRGRRKNCKCRCKLFSLNFPPNRMKFRMDKENLLEFCKKSLKISQFKKISGNFWKIRKILKKIRKTIGEPPSSIDSIPPYKISSKSVKN